MIPEAKSLQTKYKAMNDCAARNVFGEISINSHFTSVFEELESVFGFLGRKSKTEAYICDIEPMWDIQSLE